MEEAPGTAEVFSHFSLDLFWAPLLITAVAAYLVGVRRLNAQQPRLPHSAWRTALFITAAVIVGFAVMSPLNYYGNELLWVNFTGFLLLTMLAPPLIVLGRPLVLAFRVSGPRWRARLRWAYRSRVISFLTFPIVSWLLFAGVTYLWQFSILTERAATNGILRDVQQFTLLLTGLIFWYPALAIEPVRWRMAYPLRVLYVGVEMVHKGLFGGMFLSMTSPFHQHFAAATPAWGPSPMMDQRIAILILWIGGNMIFLAAIIGLITAWLRYEARNQVRVDKRLEKARIAREQRQLALEQVFSKPV